MVSQKIGGRRDSQGKEAWKTHVHDSTVDISELLEAEEPRTVCGVIESERLIESQPDSFAIDFSDLWELCEKGSKD